MKSLVRAHAIVLIGLVCLFLPTMCACDSGEAEQSWWVDPYGRFHTTDLDRAQREIPFPIAVAAYVPANVTAIPHIEGPLRGTCSEDGIEVTVTYLGRDGARSDRIMIHQHSSPYLPLDPDLNPDVSSYVEVAGRDLVRVDDCLTLSSPGGFLSCAGFSYWWSNNDVYFSVGVWGYDESEAIKVVESVLVGSQCPTATATST